MASPGHAKPSIKQHGHIRLSNVSSPIWCQVIILTNDDFLFIGHLVAKFSEQHHKDQHCLGHPAALPVPNCSCRSSCGGHRVILCPFAGGFNINRCQYIHNIPIRINSLWTSLHVSKQLIWYKMEKSDHRFVVSGLVSPVMFLGRLNTKIKSD